MEADQSLIEQNLMYGFNPRHLFISLGLTALALGLSSAAVHAAACCGGSAALPAMITGDHKAQVGLGVIGQQLGQEAYLAGDEATPNDQPISGAASAAGAFLFSDRWQAGGTIPLTLPSEGTPNLGDVSLSLAWEALPQWSYSRWKPTLYLFTEGVFPTGRSTLDPTGLSTVGTTGLGHFQNGLGLLAIKRWQKWDVGAWGKVSLLYPRTTAGNSSGLHWMTSTEIYAGWSIDSLRIGASFSWNYRSTRTVFSQGFTSKTISQWIGTFGLIAAWTWLDRWSLLVGYFDQTLFPAQSALLQRGLTLSVQHRWLR